MEDHDHTEGDIKPATSNMDEQENLDIAEGTDIPEEIQDIESNISKTDHSESDDDISDIVLANVDKTQLNDSEGDLTTASNGRPDENALRIVISEDDQNDKKITHNTDDFLSKETLAHSSQDFPSGQTLPQASENFPSGETLILATEGFPGESSTDDVDHVITDYHTETNEGIAEQLVPSKNQEELQLNPIEPKEQECDGVISNDMDEFTDTIKDFAVSANDSVEAVIEDPDVKIAEDDELCLDKEVKKVEKMVNDKQTKLVEGEANDAGMAIDKLRISDDGLSGESSTDEMYVTYFTVFTKNKK